MTKLNSEEDRQAILLFLSKAKIDDFGLSGLGVLNRVHQMFEDFKTCPIEAPKKEKKKEK